METEIKKINFQQSVIMGIRIPLFNNAVVVRRSCFEFLNLRVQRQSVNMIVEMVVR